MMVFCHTCEIFLDCLVLALHQECVSQPISYLLNHSQVGYTPGVLTDATAELTVTLLLATTRRLFEAHGELLK